MMSIDKEPFSPILVPFQQDLQLNRRGERTQQSYVRNDRKFAADKRQMLGKCWGHCQMLGTLLFDALPTVGGGCFSGWNLLKYEYKKR